MNDRVKIRLTKADIALVVVLVCLTVFLFLRPVIFPAKAGGCFTVTTPAGTSVFSLAEDKTIELDSHGIKLVLTVADGAVSVTQSDCPDGICQSTGEISHIGDAIVCVPAQVVIRVGEGGASDEDFIVG